MLSRNMGYYRHLLWPVKLNQAVHFLLFFFMLGVIFVYLKLSVYSYVLRDKGIFEKMLEKAEET